MDEKFEKLGQAIDRVNNVAHGLLIPMPADFHVRQLKELLPEIVEELKAAFVEVAGENPWD